MKIGKPLSVANYISSQIKISGIAQKDIAAALGYPHPNVISMFKHGKTKLPIGKVGAIAKVLKIDPVHLLNLALREYWPETFESIQDLIGKSLVSDKEMELIRLVRSAANGIDIALHRNADRHSIAKVISDIAKTQLPDFSAAMS